MILLDTNLLVYATVSSLPQHKKTRLWWESTVGSSMRVGLPWASLIGFIRLTCKRSVFEQPLTLKEAWSQVGQWLERPNVQVLVPGESHASILEELINNSAIAASSIDDAHLAALAIEHGFILYSADNGFSRFKGLRWHNPLNNL